MEKKNAMGKKVFRFFKVWGNIMIGAITVYSFVVTYLIPPIDQQGKFTSLFGWSWQTWLITFLISIILTLLTQNWVEKYEKDASALSTSSSANNGGLAIQQANNSPVIQASKGGIASGRDTYFTQNFFPPNTPQKISFSTINGEIEIRHNIPSDHALETVFSFTIINDTNKDLKKCAVYVDEVAFKSDADKRWIQLDDLPSPQPLKWIPKLLPTIDGYYDIDQGERLSFVLISTNKIYRNESILYNYHLGFFKDTVLLPQEKAKSHRILIRFYGSQFLGDGIVKKFYVYLDEKESGYKKYAGIEEYHAPK